ncbi:hypothetical protein D9753_20950 [Streptomyces dangxiongensis]|uniref:Uncharacterized protein n=1 Tax=Streptomyces dangxiongensis TaxID=1442032 RepID=A0A3G2JEZ4_9ACTN|nr:hypothetical protein D9753_20950 [Streptomyces dangxiongensis]
MPRGARSSGLLPRPLPRRYLPVPAAASGPAPSRPASLGRRHWAAASAGGVIADGVTGADAVMAGRHRDGVTGAHAISDGVIADGCHRARTRPL